MHKGFILYFIWRTIADEGATPRAYLWCILLIFMSDLKYCNHPSKSSLVVFQSDWFTICQWKEHFVLINRRISKVGWDYWTLLQISHVSKTFGKLFRSYPELLSKFGEVLFQECFWRNLSPGLVRWSSLQTGKVKCEANFVSSGSNTVKRIRRRKYAQLSSRGR